MHKLDEKRAFMREMKYGDTSDTYHVDSDGELSELRTYAGASARVCSNEYSDREACHRPYFDCNECIAADELFEMQQADLEQEPRKSQRCW